MCAALDFLEDKVSEVFYTFYLRDICVWKGVGFRCGWVSGATLTFWVPSWRPRSVKVFILFYLLPKGRFCVEGGWVLGAGGRHGHPGYFSGGQC